ncbi:MAG: thiol reductase thioredoxin [Finegoldia magna]|uniref:thiol reductase thioredoxin n=1 Tax=Finegoldia magna TaxID=1260 RepID=UPI002907E228|nr:thiol reductase thioredoxin [Finegoldia magna]MDU4333958.1 thiol reductase thioredoxin [Finegoldia magna]
MKKRGNLLVVLGILVILILFSLIFKKKTYTKNYAREYDDSILYLQYDENIKELKKIEVSDLWEISRNEEIIVYMGRRTCPHCVLFTAKLKLFSKSYTIYYIDSITSLNNSPNDLKKFREKNDLKTVPSLFKCKDNKVTDKMDINDSVLPSDILEFLK